MDAVVVMAKAPIANEAKTRLVPPLDPEIASELYKSFLLDKIEQVESISGIRHFVAYTPESSENLFKSIVPKEFTLINQVGSNLGERLLNTSSTIFNQGFKKVILSDSDTPNLRSEMIVDALRRLDNFDVVLGPCEDGGYYLIGLRSNMPELFRGIPWSTSGVVKSTIRKAAEIHATVSLLHRWYDVDTVESLLRLKRDLELKSQNGFFCKNSYRILAKISL